jgi:hypothetical protein
MIVAMGESQEFLTYNISFLLLTCSHFYILHV